jgi:hypothetical protein
MSGMAPWSEHSPTLCGGATTSSSSYACSYTATSTGPAPSLQPAVLTRRFLHTPCGSSSLHWLTYGCLHSQRERLLLSRARVMPLLHFLLEFLLSAMSWSSAPHACTWDHHAVSRVPLPPHLRWSYFCHAAHTMPALSIVPCSHVPLYRAQPLISPPLITYASTSITRDMRMPFRLPCIRRWSSLCLLARCSCLPPCARKGWLYRAAQRGDSSVAVARKWGAISLRWCSSSPWRGQHHQSAVQSIHSVCVCAAHNPLLSWCSDHVCVGGHCLQTLSLSVHKFHLLLLPHLHHLHHWCVWSKSAFTLPRSWHKR